MNVEKIIVSGGRLRPNGYELGDGKHYDKAVLACLDLTSGRFTELLGKDTGGEHYPSEDPNLQFTCGAIDGNRLWLPTDTEIFELELPNLGFRRTISYPSFHNIHSVQVFGNQLAVTSTGLDNVILINKQTGGIDQIINAEGNDPWHRFDPSFDYRRIHSTRPHDNHPNFVFELDGSLWVTRCTQEDAACLDDVSARIDLTGDANISVHDGIWWREQLVFTRVDGQLIICDPVEKRVVETHDPFAKKRNRPIGWCRGLFVDGDIFYIGYSRLRKTRFKSRLQYLSQGNFSYGAGHTAMVIAYDKTSDNVMQIYETPDGFLDAIYGILPWPRNL